MQVRLAGQEVAAGEMLCGGNVDVLLEPVFSEGRGRRIRVSRGSSAMTAQGRRGALVTIAADGRRGVERLIVTEEGRVIGDASGLSGVSGADLKRWAGARGLCDRDLARSARARRLVFVEPVEPEAVLLLFGAGHISTFVAPLARMVGFRVCVIDDREEFANPERFPTADRLLVCPVAGGLRAHRRHARNLYRDRHPRAHPRPGRPAGGA
ncbi:MAG: XdhC family protein [Desulfobacterales bacterium]|nr:XdhC family protein [Desulfobacterales bacterium]